MPVPGCLYQVPEAGDDMTSVVSGLRTKCGHWTLDSLHGVEDEDDQKQILAGIQPARVLLIFSALCQLKLSQ